MIPRALAMTPPSILIVDDERQIHSSLRLRLGGSYQLTCFLKPQEALTAIPRQPFDLCIVDVHMPEIDGLQFIEAARQLDPALGFVILSGYDSEENLRRAIPLQVLDFLAKPLPDKAGFESRIPDWITQTRTRRHELSVARESGSLVQDLEIARIEREVELTASASAREALLQTADLLTTIHALLFNAQHVAESLPRPDPRLATVLRSVQEARKHAAAAAAIAEGYFGSAYADRETSPALVDACLRHAVGLSLRLAKAEERRQRIDCLPLGREVALAGLPGIDFLLMLVPTLAQTLELSPTGTTLQIRCQELTRLDRVLEDPAFRSHLWVNRRQASGCSPGVLLTIRASAPALTQETAASWLRGDPTPDLRHSSRGLLHGIQKAKGLLGVALAGKAERFELILALGV
jgi:CheY-like chemotaxis protein